MRLLGFGLAGCFLSLARTAALIRLRIQILLGSAGMGDLGKLRLLLGGFLVRRGDLLGAPTGC